MNYQNLGTKNSVCWSSLSWTIGFSLEREGYFLLEVLKNWDLSKFFLRRTRVSNSDLVFPGK
jgi:hypothetical protein